MGGYYDIGGSFLKKGKWIIWTLLLLLTIYFLHPMVLNKLFPIHYQEEILKYSRKYNIDPYLIAAIIKVESNYNPYAHSFKDAMGLMQIIPSTGFWGAKELEIEDFYLEELYVVERNIEIGTWYLKKLHQQFRGDVRLVLAAYNGGSGNVTKWLSDERYSSNGRDLDYIPFAETRNYVEKVLFYRNLYSRLNQFNTGKHGIHAADEFEVCLSAKITLYLNGHSRMTIFFL